MMNKGFCIGSSLLNELNNLRKCPHGIMDNEIVAMGRCQSLPKVSPDRSG